MKRNCICYTNYDESYIKNGVCRFCSRNVDTISYDQSLKKKYQEQAGLNIRPRYFYKIKYSVVNNGNRTSIKLDNYKTESYKTERGEYKPTIQSDLKKKDEKVFRSPSNTKTRVTTQNRYTTENDEHDYSPVNPFNNKKVLGDTNKDKSQTRLNSTHKKKQMEMTINPSSIKYKK
jgi:hypothetical protein